MTKLTFIGAVFTLFFIQMSFAQDYASPLTVKVGEVDHAFTVDIADDAEEIRTGLMNRSEMPADSGMIFDFGDPREANMWMKNTLISLDMLFFNTDGVVIAIARNTTPGSLRTINPGLPVKGVLELNGGRSAELGIEPGAVIIHSVLGNTE